MTVKRAVILKPARGYVDGRYIGEEKETVSGFDDARRGKRGRGKAKDGNRAKTGRRSKVADSILGSMQARGNEGRSGNRGGVGNRGNARATPADKNSTRNTAGGPLRRGRNKTNSQPMPGNSFPSSTVNFADGIVPQSDEVRRGPRTGRSNPNPRKNRSGKKTPFRLPNVAHVSPSEMIDMRRVGEEAKSGQFAEALMNPADIKRERLHKLLAQSGHGSRRDLEIMIASGRVMVNGIVAVQGAQVTQGDMVMIDQRPVKIQWAAEMPRVLLYHKPEGEIVTTNDPGNRITVFDNLPKVENAKWIAIGRLDINTCGLLIFTTNGDLANRMMHPRFEVEREYAVRILGELTEEKNQQLLDGVMIEDDEGSELAKFDSVEARGGEGANHWYQVVIKEGRNREVRKMFEAIGLTVSRLIRTRFGKIELPPRLTRGKMVELEDAQVRSLLNWAGVKIEGLPERSANPRNANAANTNNAPNGRNPRGVSRQQGVSNIERNETRDPGQRREPKARTDRSQRGLRNNRKARTTGFNPGGSNPQNGGNEFRQNFNATPENVAPPDGDLFEHDDQRGNVSALAPAFEHNAARESHVAHEEANGNVATPMSPNQTNEPNRARRTRGLRGPRGVRGMRGPRGPRKPGNEGNV